MVRNRCLESRGDGSELLFGDAVVQGGLNGCPGVPDGCWWVFRVAVEVFDEFLCVVARLSSGVKDHWGQVDVEGTCRTFSFLLVGHVT